MLNNDFLTSLSRQLAGLIPMADDIRNELRTKIEQQLQASFANLNILGREEFEAQCKTLQRAQQRVEELEQLLTAMDVRLTELEAQAKQPDTPT